MKMEIKLSRLSENVNELSKKKELISIIQKSPKHTPRQITWGDISCIFFYSVYSYEPLNTLS